MNAGRFGYDAVVQVLTRGAVEAAAAAYPFATLDDHHDYLIFCDDPDVTVAVAEAMGPFSTQTAPRRSRQDRDASTGGCPGARR